MLKTNGNVEVLKACENEPLKTIHFAARIDLFVCLDVSDGETNMA